MTSKKKTTMWSLSSRHRLSSKQINPTFRKSQDLTIPAQPGAGQLSQDLKVRVVTPLSKRANFSEKIGFFSVMIIVPRHDFMNADLAHSRGAMS
jgi:hypothetical protein